MAGTGERESLQRLGGGRWRTRDERFLIEPQSGTWVVVDAEQTDELGLALVRGPFGSLTAAKAAIAEAREAKPEASPLAERAERIKRADPERPESRASVTKPKRPDEPRWIAEMPASDRRRAQRLIERLTNAGAPDPDGMARRDIAGDTPAVAAYALERAIAGLGPNPDAAAVVRLLQDGRDPDLDVRWQLIDGEGRPITVSRRKRGA